jgi:hypothetical protein
MPTRLSVLVILGIAVGFGAAPTEATAVVCGDRDPATKQVVNGVLTLNINSVTTKAFKRSTGTKRLYLDYRVDGCDIGLKAEAPQVLAHAAAGGDDMPKGSWVARVSRMEPHRVALDLDVDLDALGAGSFASLMEVGANYLETVQTPISASHSSGPFPPLGLAIVGALVGVFFTVRLGRRTKRVVLTVKHELMLLAIGLGAGLLAGFGTWFNQDVWVFLSSNSLATLLAGYVTATTGNALALARVLSGIEEPVPARDPQPAGRAG